MSRVSATPPLQPSARPVAEAVYSELTFAQISALPEAKYNAVIPGLLAAHATDLPKAVIAYSVSADTPIYGADRTTPVARFAARNFLGSPTTVVPIDTLGQWALVLTPARQFLPSASAGNAPAQTSGWVRLSALSLPVPLTHRIVISIVAQTLTIVGSDNTSKVFRVGVGAAETPTPAGITGYIQARYLDPKQNQRLYPIQLTSMHSAMADEPYGGHDGGLIGVHYEAVHTGDISHGCVRLASDAITAVDALPLGTLVTIVN